MKLTWDNSGGEIGVYICTLAIDDHAAHRIYITDFDCEYRKQCGDFEKFKPVRFRVSFCHGFSMTKDLDDTYTLESAKVWAEDFLLNMLIDSYEDAARTLETMRGRAEWAKNFKAARTA